MKYACSCCGNYTINKPGWNEICPVCFWEDDCDILDCESMANKMTLNQARENYKAFGACDESLKQFVRRPLSEELPENNK